MKTTFIRVVIVMALALQAVWVLMPRFGSSPPSFRVRQAIESNLQSPKAVQNRAIAEAEDQDGAEGGRSAMVMLALFLGCNAMVVYFLWNYGVQKKPEPAS